MNADDYATPCATHSRTTPAVRPGNPKQDPMAEQFSVDQAKEVLEGGMAEATELISNPEKINELLAQVQEFVKGLPGSAADSLANIPLMAQMVKGYVTKEYTEVSPKVIATLVAAFLYLVKQKDLIPDSVPVLGMLDDVAVVALAMKLCENELAAYKAWAEGNGGLDTPELTAGAEA